VGGAAVCDQSWSFDSYATLSLDLLRGPVRRFWGVAAGLIHGRRKPAEGPNSELTLILRQFFAKFLVATESAEFFLTVQMQIWLPSELDPAAFIVLGTCHV
jgi:hypothetical protein